MPWLDKKENWIPGTGRRSRRRPLPRSYSVAQVAEMLGVHRNTVYKYISAGTIPDGEWYKLPGGDIRIREGIVTKLMKGEV